MNRIKITANFYLDEFIPKELYYAHPTWKLMRLIDPRTVQLMQIVRERHGARNVNNWATGGNRNYSGLRPINTPYYNQFSDHSYGRASDSIGITPVQEIWQDIRENYEKIYKPAGLTIIETNVGWLHMGCGWTGLHKLLEVQP